MCVGGQLRDGAELHVLLQPLADVAGVLLHRGCVVVYHRGGHTDQWQVDALRDVGLHVGQYGQVRAGLRSHASDRGEPVALLGHPVNAWRGRVGRGQPGCVWSCCVVSGDILVTWMKEGHWLRHVLVHRPWCRVRCRLCV